MKNRVKIGERTIGSEYSPLVIAEIGINHEGSFEKAIQMVDDACLAGCECVKFQCHVIEDEMIPAAKNIVPENATISIWDIMKRCSLNEQEDRRLKNYVESKNMIYLSTPFSRAATERLQKMDVLAYKIGSGECNNYPLIEHIARFKKPVILSTGMNDLASIRIAVNILRNNSIPYALLHCTSMYPTPYDKVRLNAMTQLKEAFRDAVIGLSDHSIGNYTCFGAVALGASILEKHFTSDKNWPGPDIPISIDRGEMEDLIFGSNVIFRSLQGQKEILKEEKNTIEFAYASIVTIENVKKGEKFTKENVWVKRPGTGELLAKDFSKVLGKKAAVNIMRDTQLSETMVME